MSSPPRSAERTLNLTDVVNESCIRCKTMDCVDVCPVDCFYEGENMLVIHPDECIDCGVCEPECPVDAIKPDTEPGLEKWLSLNADYAAAQAARFCSRRQGCSSGFFAAFSFEFLRELASSGHCRRPRLTQG